MDDNDAGASRKRRRTDVEGNQSRRRSNEHPHAEGSSGSNIITIDAVDDAGEDNLMSEVLHKQRQEQIAMQKPQGDKPVDLQNLQCAICLDTPSDLTSTLCGHVFCHECLEQSLRASERRSSDARKSNCPVCRKVLQRKKKNDMIPLVFMKRPAKQVEGVAEGKQIAK